MVFKDRDSRSTSVFALLLYELVAEAGRWYSAFCLKNLTSINAASFPYSRSSNNSSSDHTWTTFNLHTSMSSTSTKSSSTLSQNTSHAAPSSSPPQSHTRTPFPSAGKSQRYYSSNSPSTHSLNASAFTSTASSSFLSPPQPQVRTRSHSSPSKTTSTHLSPHSPHPSYSPHSPSTLSRQVSYTPSSTNATANSSSSPMHAKLTNQMRGSPEYPIESYVEPERRHPHLDAISSALRRLRG